MTWMRRAMRTGLILWLGVCMVVHAVSLAGVLADWYGMLFFGCMAAVFVAYWMGPGRKVVGPPPSIGLLRGGLFVTGVLYPLLFGLIASWATGRWTSDGVPGGNPGERYLHSHGTKLRDIDDDEYHLRRADTQRQFTAAYTGITLCAVAVSFFPPMRGADSDRAAGTPPAAAPAPGPPNG